MEKCEVLYQIKTLEKLIFRELLKENAMFENGGEFKPPTPTQMQIIEYILEHFDEDVYQRDLENILKLRRATVSGVLMTMEKNKLIERVIDHKDTRSKKIILNTKAKEIFLKNVKKMKEIENTITNGVSEEELDVFFKVISKMKQNIEKNGTILK